MGKNGVLEKAHGRAVQRNEEEIPTLSVVGGTTGRCKAQRTRECGSQLFVVVFGHTRDPSRLLC